MFLVFAGYTLVYAAVAKQGAFATDPWAGLFADAYEDLPPINLEGTTIQPSYTGPTPTPPGFGTLQPPVLNAPQPRINRRAISDTFLG